MCQVYAMTDPILYESRSRSVRIHGAITGIRLENLFWQLLSTMAESEGMTTNQLIVKLHEEVSRHRGEVTNFTSFLRVTCLRYQALLADSKLLSEAVSTVQEHAASAGMVYPLEAVPRRGSPKAVLTGAEQRS
jgi:predicted DNA-binding ribbon-helix-helix protein